MPDISSEKATAVCYPPDELYKEWQQHATSLDISVSQYLIRMVEAGRKQVDFEDVAQQSVQELHSQYTDLQQELARQRQRNEKLEQQLHHTVQGEIIEFVKQNPGATTAEIIQNVADTVPGRVASHLDILEGDTLEARNNGYYCQPDSNAIAGSNQTEDGDE